MSRGLVLLCALTATIARAALPQPAAVVDLRTTAGMRLLGAQWRWHPAEIVAVDHREPGPDLRASGVPNRTQDLVPHAGAADFDDASWEAIPAEGLETRRGHGRLSFVWYRTTLTIPPRVGDVDPTGTTAVLEIVLDDYAEVWVDGRLPTVLGRTGGALVAGFNAPNRVVLGHDVRPGQRFAIAVLGANGPLSAPPANFVWVRSATLDLVRPAAPATVPTAIDRRDPELEAVVPAGAQLEHLAGGFRFTEGPVWHPDGYLLFSDPNDDVIYRWAADEPVSIYRTKSGFAGTDIAAYGQPGSNGLALDAFGRLTVNEHGNRRVVRIEATGAVTVLADRFEGKRLDSPNDLAYGPDGTLCFTDPPFGLPRFAADPRRELGFSGVYCLVDGTLRLVDDGLAGPNGIVFAPDGRGLYVANWDPQRRVLVRYPVGADGVPHGPGTTFVRVDDVAGDAGLDGIEVDVDGRLYVTAPDGIRIYAADGRLLGTLRGPETAHNLAWGDADRRTLYVAAETGLYRIRLDVAGPPPPRAVTRRNARLDAVLPRDAALERVADGFVWTEGPVWRPATGDLLFTDIPENVVLRWAPGVGVGPFLSQAGWSGPGAYAGREPGANGLALDGDGRLVLCEHGNRRVTRLEPDGTRTVLADRFEGKRLNSPNDVVVTANGDVWFTDPPFGLPAAFDDPARELPWSGVYRRTPHGALTLATRALPAPNGLAFAPDGRALYVSNARGPAAWYAFDVAADGTLGPPRLLLDATPWTRIHAGDPDGIEVAADGTLFAAGPGGVHVIAADGTHLGLVETGGATANLAWGDDGGTLYVTAGRTLWRLRTATRGAGR